MTSSRDSDIARAFLEEAKDCLRDLETDIVAMEKCGDHLDPELVNRLFRSVHSIKGSSGFLGLVRIRDLSHGMENVLNGIRRKELKPTHSIINALLTCSDLLAMMINDHEDSGTVNITGCLEELAQASTHSQENRAEEHITGAALPGGEQVFTLPPEEYDRIRAEGLFLYLLEYHPPPGDNNRDTAIQGLLDELSPIGMSIVKGKAAPSMKLLSAMMTLPGVEMHVVYNPDALTESKELAPDEGNGLKPRTCGSIVLHTTDDTGEDSVFLPHQVRQEPQSGEEELLIHSNARNNAAAQETRPGTPQSIHDETIRVNLKTLDSLMTLAGELVLTRNQLLDGIRSWNRKGIEAGFQRLNLVTAGVQETVMSTRMQPIDSVFSKFQRLVRDSAHSIGKEVSLSISGQEVELDRTVIEAIADPLRHMIRNCIDHGIETPAERKKAGKPATGTVTLSALHQAGQVRLIISDDGAGIDIERIRQLALSTGRLTQAQEAALSDKEIVRLIFLPGFSTSPKITNLSGRGVGMDVVYSNLTKIGGVIDINTEPGSGTTFEITLPLTLAIIPCLLVSLGEEHFAIPQVNIVELVRVRREEKADKIQKIGPALLFRLRGDLLPLTSLREILGIRPHLHAHGEKQWYEEIMETKAPVNIVVVTIGELHYGIVVDRFIESEEVVVKPLAPVSPAEGTTHVYIIVAQKESRESGFMVSRILDIVETDRPIDRETFRQQGIIGSTTIMDRTTLIIDPFHTAFPGTPATEKAPVPERHHYNPSILIVEDSEFFLEKVNEIVKDAGYEGRQRGSLHNERPPGRPPDNRYRDAAPERPRAGR